MNKKKGGALGIIITIIILIILVFLSNTDTQKLSYIENAVSTIIMPIQNGLTENEELKQKNTQLEQSLRELEIIKAENTTLKEYVNLTDKYKEYQSIPAYIINRNISNYNSLFIINVGAKDGVAVNMTVIADMGLVGHIVEVNDSTAKVQTIIDTANSVSSVASSSKNSVLCRGMLGEKKLKATYIETDETIIEGDSVETSGLGGIYPKGIHIGTIEKVVNTQNVTDRYAIVKPDVDFNKIETVLVLKN